MEMIREPDHPPPGSTDQSPGPSTPIPSPSFPPPDALETTQEQSRRLDAHRDGVAVTTAFALALVLVYILGSIFKPDFSLMMPISFIPTACFLYWWKHSSHQQEITFHSLVYAYAIAFFFGSLLVTLYQLLVLVFLIIFTFGAVKTDAGYYIILLLFVVFGQSLGSEGIKYIMALHGRTVRPDLQSTHAYLMFTCSAALGFATFFIIISQLLDQVAVQTLFLALLLRVLFDIPMHVLSACLIGSLVAKNNIFQWNTPWHRILLLPVIARATPAYTFYAMLRGGSSHAALISVNVVLYVIFIGVLFFFTRRELGTLPQTFGRIQDNDEIDLPNPFDLEEHL